MRPVPFAQHHPNTITSLLAIILLVFSGCANTEKSNISPDTSPYISIFGKNVLVFDDSMDQDSIKTILDALHEQQKYNEFSLERYALLFKPGRYELDVTVDYYVQALGLGRYPGDVIINGSVQSITTRSSNGVSNKVTTMFWRGAENMKVVPKDDDMIYWAVTPFLFPQFKRKQLALPG